MEREPEITSFNDPRLLPVYESLGYFYMWFSSAEAFLTVLLGVLCDAASAKKFAIAVSGMDARIKCERLRKAAKLSFPMGHNFSSWLKDFEEKSVPLRNRLSHRLIMPTSNALGFHVLAFGEGDRVLSQHCDVSAKTLYQHAEWLNVFSTIIEEIVRNVRQSGKVETDAENPHPPTEQTPPQKAKAPSTPDTPAQT